LLLDKKPAIKWEPFQTRIATSAEIDDWFAGPPRMLGIVTGKLSNLSVIDIDNKEGEHEIMEILPSGFHFPKVYTPSGGWHMYCKYREGLRNASRVIEGIDIRSEGGYVVAPPSINSENKAYSWDNNYNLSSIELPLVPSGIIEYKALNDQMGNRFVNEDLEMFTQGRRDEDLFHTANCLVKGGMVIDEVYPVIRTLAKSCRPPFPNKEVDEKVRSAIERGLRRERNLSTEIKEWVMSSNGIFLSSEVARTLQLSSRDEQKHLSKTLARLVDEGILERHGNRAGMFRRIQKDFTEMYWQDASIEPLNVLYPLGLHNLFRTFCKNVIVIAGVKDAGKTAFMLDFIKQNQKRWKIHYFTNEMGEEELKLRLLAHKDMRQNDWNFKAYEVGGAWEDAIMPNDITIIDYLEINNDFCTIGEIIKRMHEKLDKGILLLGLQQAEGARLGRGAAFSLQRPRMYLTLDSGIATIISAKNRIPGRPSPVGYTMNYEVIDGWKLHQLNEWSMR